MASGASIRAGEAFVEGTFRDEKLVAGLRAWQSKLRSAANTARSIGLQLGAAGAAIAGPILVSLNTYRKLGAELDDMAKRTGIAADKLSEIRFAASQSGTDLATFETAVKTMQKSLLEAEQGGAKAVETLERLGLSVEDLRGLSGDEQFGVIARQLNRIEEPGLKAAMALRIFGRSGQALVPMISELEQLTRAAHELGVVMSPEAAAQAAALDDAMDALRATFEGTRAAVGAAVAPMATDLVNATTAVVAKTTEWIKRNEHVVQTLAAIGGAMVGAGAGLGAVSGVLHTVVIAVDDVIKGVKYLGAIWVTGLAPASVALATLLGTLTLIVAATTEWWKRQNLVNDAVAEAATKQTGQESESLGQNADRFAQLATKGKLTAAEMDEARHLAPEMRVEYGIQTSLSTDAGGFTNGSRDVAQLQAARTRRSALAIDNEIAIRRWQMDVEAEKHRKAQSRPTLFDATSGIGSSKAVRDGEFAAEQAKRQAEIDRLQKEKADNARFIASARPLADPSVTAAKLRADEIADAQEQIEDDLAEARIQAMKEGLDKQLKLIDQSEQEALRELEQSGLFSGSALEAERGKIRQRFGFERQGARRDDAQEKDQEATRKAKERADEIEAIDDQLARAKIAAMEEGLDKELALIDQREQEARRELEQSELFSGEQLAEMLAKLDATFGLEREVANRENASVELAAAGTFQGALADQQLGRQSVAEEHLKWIREFTRRTADQAENGDGGLVLS